MGGIEVKVPADLEVECHGTALLGGVTFFDEEGGGIVATRHYTRSVSAAVGRRPRIYCTTLRGGVEVK